VTRGLSGHELAQMRQTADEYLPDAISVWRATRASDSGGGQTSTFARVASLRGRKSPLTTVESEEQVYADRLGGNQGWWLSLPRGTDVRLGDQLRSDGLTFEVVSTDASRSWDITLRVMGKELV